MQGSFIWTLKLVCYFKILVTVRSGCLSVRRRIDFEELLDGHKALFNLTLQATLSSHRTKAQIRIKVVDIDDNPPEIKLLNPKTMPLMLSENPNTGQKLAEFLVVDRDNQSQQFHYKLSGLKAENFQVRAVSLPTDLKARSR